MSTLTKYSAIPYTGPAPTNRENYVPTEAVAADTRGQEIAAKLAKPYKTIHDVESAQVRDVVAV